MLVKLMEFILYLAFYGSIALIIEHRKQLFSFPKIKNVWSEVKNDFFGLEK